MSRTFSQRSICGRAAAVLTAAALLLAVSPVPALRAAGVGMAVKPVVGINPGGVSASGAAAAGAAGRIGTLKTRNLSLKGSGIFAVNPALGPTPRTGAQSTTFKAVSLALTPGARQAGLSPAKLEKGGKAVRLELGPVAVAAIALRRASRLKANGISETIKPRRGERGRRAGNLDILRRTGAVLKDGKITKPEILNHLFTGRELTGDGPGFVPLDGMEELGSVLLEAAAPAGESAKRESGSGVKAAPQGLAAKSAGKKAWYKRAGVWKSVLGALAAGVFLLAAPALGHAAGAALAPGLTELGFDAAMSALAQVGYLGANAIGFVYVLPQVYKLIRNRSGKVAAGTVLTGAIASGILAFNAAYSAKTLWAFQNLMGSLGFLASIGLMWIYGRRAKKAGTEAQAKGTGWRRRLADAGKAVIAFALLGGAAYLGAMFLVGIVPAMPMAGAMIVPLQMIAALGFAFLFMPQYIKMMRERSSGDASIWTTLGYLGATMGISFWALWQAALIPGGAALANLLILGAFVVAVMVPSHFVLRGMGHIPWNNLPEKVSIGKLSMTREGMVNTLSLLLLAAYLAVVLGLGVAGLSGALELSGPAVNQFWMYVLYVVENVFSALVSFYALMSFRRFRTKAK